MESGQLKILLGGIGSLVLGLVFILVSTIAFEIEDVIYMFIVGIMFMGLGVFLVVLVVSGFR